MAEREYKRNTTAGNASSGLMGMVGKPVGIESKKSAGGVLAAATNAVAVPAVTTPAVSAPAFVSASTIGGGAEPDWGAASKDPAAGLKITPTISAASSGERQYQKQEAETPRTYTITPEMQAYREYTHEKTAATNAAKLNRWGEYVETLSQDITTYFESGEGTYKDLMHRIDVASSAVENHLKVYSDNTEVTEYVNGVSSYLKDVRDSVTKYYVMDELGNSDYKKVFSSEVFTVTGLNKGPELASLDRTFVKALQAVSKPSVYSDVTSFTNEWYSRRDDVKKQMNDAVSTLCADANPYVEQIVMNGVALSDVSKPYAKALAAGTLLGKYVTQTGPIGREIIGQVLAENFDGTALEVALAAAGLVQKEEKRYESMSDVGVEGKGETVITYEAMTGLDNAIAANANQYFLDQKEIERKKNEKNANIHAIGSNFVTGLAQFGSQMHSAADWLIPDDQIAKLFGVENKVGDWFDDTRPDMEAVNKWSADLSADAGDGYKWVGQNIVRPVSAAMPNLILSLASPFTAATGAEGFVPVVKQTVSNAVKNPNFWLSFAQVGGSAYQSAIDSGATEAQAQAVAWITAIPGAMLESNLGLEKQKDAAGIGDILKNIVGEGLEEVAQGAIEQAARTVVFEHENQWRSLTDPDAVLSGTRAVQEFIGGVTVSAVMGAPGAVYTAADYAYQSYRYAKSGSEYINAQNGHSIDEAIQIGLSTAKGTDTYQAAVKIQQKVEKGESVTPYTVGRMVAESFSQQAMISKSIEQTVLNTAKALDIPTEAAETVAAAAVALGQKVEFVSPEQMHNRYMAGEYVGDTDTVRLNAAELDTDKLIGAVVAHEMVHAAEGTRQLRALEKTVEKLVGTEKWNNLKESAVQSYAARNAKVSDDGTKEALATWVSRNLFQKGFAEAVAKGDANVGATYMYLIDRVRRTFVKQQENPSARNIAMLERLFMQAIDARTHTGKEGVQGAVNGAPVIDLSDHSKLAKRVEGVYGAKKYIIIQNYILEVLGDQPIQLSDGKTAIVDKKDALHIAHNAASKKTAEIAEIKQLVEKAVLYAEDVNPTHNKFNYFCYYKSDVKYDGEVFPLYLNVGRAINTGEYHLYDITNKIRDTADRINGLERPKSNEGYALTNGVSDTNVAQKSTDVNTQSMPEGAGIYSHGVQDGVQGALLSEESMAAVDNGTWRDIRAKRMAEGVTPSADGYTSSVTAGAATPSPREESLTAGAVVEIPKIKPTLSQNSGTRVYSRTDPAATTGIRVKVAGTKDTNGVEMPKVTPTLSKNSGTRTYSRKESVSRKQVDVSDLQKTNRRGQPHYDADAAIDRLETELGADELLKRMYNATQMNRPTGLVEIDGKRMDANAYMERYERTLPDDPTALEETVRRLEQERAAEIVKMQQEGTLGDYTFGGLKVDIQLFAAKRKYELLQLDPGENGKEVRQFYEKRLRGTDANHNDQLVEMLAGRNETYNPIANEKTLERAKDKLRNDKYKASLLKRIGRYNSRDLFTDQDVAAATVLINDAINDGDLGEAADMIIGLSRKGTIAGRAVQAFSMMARMTPEGTLKAAIRTLQADADTVIGEGANEKLDVLADDIVKAIVAAEEEGLSSEEIAQRIRNGEAGGVEDAAPYDADPTWDGTAGNDNPSMEGASREQLVKALTDDLAATKGNYLSKEQIGKIVEKAVNEAANIPEQLKRYVLKKIRKDDGGLAQRIYEVYRKGDLNSTKMRRAMEEALELPHLTDEDVKWVVEKATEIQSLESEPVKQAEAMDELYDYLGAKMTVRFSEKLAAWRKFAMLANPKTHIRNFVSNVAYVPIRNVDSLLATGIEWSLMKLHLLKPEQRAAAFGWRCTKHGQKIIDTIRERVPEAVLEMQGRGAKYEDGSRSLKQHRKMHGDGVLGNIVEKVDDFNAEWMEKEDIIFFKTAYVDALGQVMTARKATKVTDEMHGIAMKRALEATFRNKNRLSEWISAPKRGMNSDKWGTRVAVQAYDVVIPFVNTPAAIMEQTALHSPVGIAVSGVDLILKCCGKSDKSASDIINTFAKGLTGSMLFYIGCMLVRSGFLRIAYRSGKKDKAADEMEGKQANSLIFGDVSVPIDWLQPVAAPLIMGGAFAEAVNAKEDDTIESVLGVGFSAAESLFTLSMLQSFYDVVGGYSGGFGGGVAGSLGTIAENVITQSWPTILGQAARALDPVQRKVSDGTLKGSLLNPILARIPWVSRNLDPELDVWGNEVYRTGYASDAAKGMNVLQQFVSPSNFKRGTAKNDPISAELLRLYHEHNARAAIPTDIDPDDAKEAGEDYVELNKLLGGANRLAVEEFINNEKAYEIYEETGEFTNRGNPKKKKVTKYYRDMTDEERINVLENHIYAKAKDEVLGKTDHIPEEYLNESERYFRALLERVRQGERVPTTP